jgi:type I restriction enzyme, R subunit
MSKKREINEQNLNANQIVFVNKVIDYIEQNGYVENASELMKPPFDKPQSFIKLLMMINKRSYLVLLMK